MAYVFKPPTSKRWHCRLKIGGKWVSRSTPFTDEKKAKRYADAAQRKIDQSNGRPIDNTVRAYAIDVWLPARQEEGADWTHDRADLENHILPVLGTMALADVRTVHIADFVRKLRFRKEKKLASRTVRNIYFVLKAMFRDAAIAGLIDVDPCILTDKQLGRAVDKDREWRTGALFTRDEAEALISDPRIPFDRQMVYAFGLLAGMRPGEAAALRWRHYDPTEQPLGRLLIASSYNTKSNATKGTKTETVKTIPVHPTLAAMLAEWRATGWAAMMGREPTPDDLIIPLPPDTVKRRTRRTGDPNRGYDYTGKRWREVDLPMLGWRHRSVYDTKSTFITLAIEDGADDDVIRNRVTHTKQKRNAFDGYDRGPHWLQTCAEVAKLRISRPQDRVTPDVTPAEDAKDSATLLGSGGGFRTPEDHYVISRENAGSDENLLGLDSFRGPSKHPGITRHVTHESTDDDLRTSCDVSLALMAEAARKVKP